MKKELIKTKDTDIVIERTFNDKTIDKKELRQEKKELNQTIKDLENKIEKLGKVNIREEFQYLIDFELTNLNMELENLKQRLQIIEEYLQ